MPYKDSQKAKDYAKEAMKKSRQGITKDDNVIPEKKGNVIPEKKGNVIPLTRPNRLNVNGVPEMVKNEYNPDEMLPDGRKRYLGPMSDGQVLDRKTLPYTVPESVGTQSGQSPFWGLASVIFSPRNKG